MKESDFTEEELVSISEFRDVQFNGEDEYFGRDMDWPSLCYGFFRAKGYTPERAHTLVTYAWYGEAG